jgi:hypothetical protein
MLAEAGDMIFTTEQTLAMEASARRERAEAVLQSLLAAKAECEKQLARFKRPDMIKSVTGQSALDAAIASTKRMIESLNRTLADAGVEADDHANLARARHRGAAGSRSVAMLREPGH